MRYQLSALACAGVALASGASAQFNDPPRNNGGDVVFFYSDPSAGAPAGTVPPDLQGDLYWTAHSGADHLAYVDSGGVARMEVSGYYESLWDTYWSTSPTFYTRVHGTALPAGPGLLQPSSSSSGSRTRRSC